MTDRPQAKLVKHTPSGHRLPYWDRYEFECVDCGAIYIRSANTNRINPYCAECSRKHQRERDEANRKRRQLEHDMKVKADAVDEFARLFIEEGNKRKYLRHIWIENTCEKISKQMKEQNNNV